jgi:hypothetical protein
MREAVEARLLPLADENEADVLRIAELGRVDPLLLLQAVRSQYEAKLRLIDARVAESIGAIRFDELLGPPVSPSAQTDKSETDALRSDTPGDHQ